MGNGACYAPIDTGSNDGISGRHAHNDKFRKERTFDVSRITVPFYTVVNFYGHPISTNCHFRLMRESATPNDRKWLELITEKHAQPMYSGENVLTQWCFLGFILKKADNGFNKALPSNYNFAIVDE